MQPLFLATTDSYFNMETMKSNPYNHTQRERESLHGNPYHHGDPAAKQDSKIRYRDSGNNMWS